MGLSMPKFISDKYNSLKDTCSDIREGWRATKLIFKLFRQLEVPKGSETHPQTAEGFVETLKNSEDLPESFKNLLSSVDSDTLNAMLKVTMQAFSKNSDNQTEPVNVEEAAEKKSNIESENWSNISQDNGQPKAATSDGNHREKNVNETFSKNIQSENPSAQATQDEELDFIPSQTQKTIFKMANKNIGGKHTSQKNSNSAKDSYGTATFRTAKEFQDFTKRAFKRDNESQQSETQNPNEKNLPPVKKLLRQELEKKIGSDWKTKVPSFLKNPNMGPIPDLGLGLSKDGNRDMVIQMSNVLKDMI